MAGQIVRAVFVLCGIALVANSVQAQYGLRRAPHVLNLEEFDSDEIGVPLGRRIVPAPDGSASFKRHLRSHGNAPRAPIVVTPAEQIPLSDDLIEHLETLLRMAQQKKKAKAAHRRTQPEVKQVESQTPPAVFISELIPEAEPIHQTTEAPTSAGSSHPTTPPSSREVGKKWFPVLLQEAIDNVLRRNDTEDELDELVDHIAAGSGTYRLETNAPGMRFNEEFSELLPRDSRDQVEPAGSKSPNRPGSASVPYVVNIFNNSHIGYIVMKVSNESEVIVQESQDDPAYGPSHIDLGRRARKIAPGVVEESLVPRKKSPLSNSGYQKLTSHATFSTNPRNTPEPPFFNLLKTPDPEPIKYRVLLRDNNDDKLNVRLPLPASLGKAKYQSRPSQGRGRPTLPVLYSQGPPAGLKDRKRNPLTGMVDLGIDSRPALGRVVRRFDYESLEEELPYEEAEFTYPDTVTEPTAKLLATGRHGNSLVKAASVQPPRTRTTVREPFKATRKYNLRRTFAPADSGESLESEGIPTPTPPMSPTTTPEPDSFEEGELLWHQPTTNVFLKAKKDWGAYRRPQQRDDDAVDNRSGPLKVTFDTGKEDPLASLFEAGSGKRPYRKPAPKKHVPWSISDEERDDSHS